MPEFYYKAVSAAGKSVEGALQCETETAAARELQRMGLAPVHIGQGPAPKAGANAAALDALLARAGRRRTRVRDRMFFTQELATLVSSGLPLDRALAICAELTERASFRTVLNDVLRELKSGKSLAESFQSHPEVFGDLYVNMVRAGEASGALDTVLERLSEFERSSGELRSFLVSSLIYPALLAVVGAGSILVMMRFVVPRFAQVFADSRMPVPGPTAVMLAVSDALRNWGWVALLAAAVVAVAARYRVSTPGGRAWWHARKLRVPILGELFRKAETARFARTMSTLIANGVALVQALRIARGLIGNVGMQEALGRVTQAVQRGEGLAAPLRRTAAFPPLAAHLLTVGEETGRLDTMFERMADIYDRDTRAAVKRATALFEPLVILTMGLIVGAIVLSMLMAIVSINDVPL